MCIDAIDKWATRENIYFTEEFRSYLLSKDTLPRSRIRETYGLAIRLARAGREVETDRFEQTRGETDRTISEKCYEVSR